MSPLAPWDKKYYRMFELRKAFAAAGLFEGSNQIAFTLKMNRLEKNGRLRVPRNSRTGHRYFTKEQIAELVEAFSPEGAGYWYYKTPAATELERYDQKI